MPRTKKTETEKATPAPSTGEPEAASETVLVNPLRDEPSQPTVEVASEAEAPPINLPAVLGTSSAAVGGVDASLIADIRIPRLNLVANTGELARQFTPGSFVLNRSILIAGPSQPFSAIVLNVGRKRWLKRSADLGAPPVWADSEQQVKELGGTTSYQVWKDNQANLALFRPYVVLHMLVQRSSAIGDSAQTEIEFPFEIHGTRYALAAYGVTGVAYNNLVRRLLTERFFGVLRKGWSTYIWSVKSANVNFKTVWAWVPQITPLRPVTPEELASLNQLCQWPTGEESEELEAEDNVEI